MNIVRMAAFVALAAIGVVGPAGAQTAMRPGITRQVTTGATDTATSADYLGWIAWKSATASPKTQTLPACAPSNNGMWLGVIDEQGTAATYPITVQAASGTVGGAVNVPINSALGSNMFACDGASANWNVVANNFAAAVSANQSVGVFGGTMSALTMISPIPPIATNTAFYRVCGLIPAGIPGSITTGATFAAGSSPALPIRKQNQSGLVPLVSGDVTSQVQYVCLNADNSGTGGAPQFWILDGLGQQIVSNPGIYSVTAADWTNSKVFLNTSGVNAYTLPPATGLSGGGIIIVTRGVAVSLSPQPADGINALPVNTAITVPDGLMTTVLSTGVAGAGAFQVPLGPTRRENLTWIPGQNLGSCAAPPCPVYIFHTEVPMVVSAASCQIALAAGGAATFDYMYVIDGSTTMNVINSGSPACNANSTVGTLQVATLTATLIPANSSIGLKVLQSWGGTLGSGVTEMRYNRD